MTACFYIAAVAVAATVIVAVADLIAYFWI